jgi:geranylgeranyl diphosphate synthase type II
VPDANPHHHFDLTGYLTEKRALINHALTQICEKNLSDTRLDAAMKYSLMASGKRLRPILCMAAAETVGNPTDAVVRTACAIEMIHTYSLIHDDLPAMDNDDMRRGNPTCNVQFDEATAVLAGDALLTLAFDMLSAKSSEEASNDTIILNIIHLIAAASGHKGMIDGQMRDIEAENTLPSLDALKKIHYLKTGALIEAAVVSGALLAGGDIKAIEKLRIYANNIGLAFQVADDILNVEGDAATMGKATGTDASRNKATYPGILGLEKSREFTAELVNKALHALAIFGNKADSLAAIARYVVHRKR